MQPPLHHPHAADPFQGARSVSGPLIVLLALRASMRVVTYAVMRLVASPGNVSPEEFETIKFVDMGLLGIENLLTIVTMIFVFIWLYRLIKGIRNNGGQTTISAGMSIGGWFIPFANLVLPWLAVRGALKGLGRSTIIAGLWWLAWLANTALGFNHVLFRQIRIMPELMDVIPPEMMDSLFRAVETTFWPYFIADTLAYALLAVAVVTARKAITEGR